MDKKMITRLALAGMMAGGLTAAKCQQTTANSPNTGEPVLPFKAQMTLEEFQAACTETAGIFKTTGCNHTNDCKGHAYDKAKTPPVTRTTNEDQNSCQGGACQEKV